MPELGGQKLVDAVVEILAHAPDGAAVGIDGLGSQTLELEMLDVALVAMFEVGLSVAALTAIYLTGRLHNHPVQIDKGEVCSVGRFRGDTGMGLV